MSRLNFDLENLKSDINSNLTKVTDKVSENIGVFKHSKDAQEELKNETSGISRYVENLKSDVNSNLTKVTDKVSENIGVFKHSKDAEEEMKNEASGISRYIEMANWPAIGSIVLPNIGGIANGFYFCGQLCKADNKTWYDSLDKPTWAMPKCAFGPTWTAMYTSMGYASYIVFRECDGFTEDAVLPLTLYGGQLLLNWAYAPIFFGLKDLKLAFIEISVLSGAAVATTAAFFKVDKRAGWLMVPYLAWLGYATAAAHYIWKNNQGPEEKIKELKDDIEKKF